MAAPNNKHLLKQNREVHQPPTEHLSIIHNSSDSRKNYKFIKSTKTKTKNT